MWILYNYIWCCSILFVNFTEIRNHVGFKCTLSFYVIYPFKMFFVFVFCLGFDPDGTICFAYQLFWSNEVLCANRDGKISWLGSKITTLEFLGVLLPFWGYPWAAEGAAYDLKLLLSFNFWKCPRCLEKWMVNLS